MFVGIDLLSLEKDPQDVQWHPRNSWNGNLKILSPEVSKFKLRKRNKREYT